MTTDPYDPDRWKSASAEVVVNKDNMKAEVEGAIALLQALSQATVIKSVRKNLKRAIISTVNARKVYDNSALSSQLLPNVPKKTPCTQTRMY